MLEIQRLCFFITLYFVSHREALMVRTEKTDVCLSPDCVKIASLLLNSIDETADPCENFWQFACGKWIKTHVINDDETVTGVYYDLKRRVNVILKNLLEEETTNEKEIVRSAKRFYQSCSNTDSIEKENLTSAYAMIESLGGWPVLGTNARGQWSEANFNLEQLLISSQKIKSDIIIIRTSSCKCFEPSEYVLCIEKPSFGLRDDDAYLNGYDDKSLIAYEKYAREMAILFGAEPTAAKVQIREMIDFETEMANASILVDDHYVEEKVNISYLNTNFPEFDWMQYFSGVLGRPGLNIPVDDATPICSRVSFDSIKTGIKILRRNTKRVVQNYVVWRQLMELSDALPKRIREINTDFIKVTEGRSKQSDRWFTCIKEVEDIFRLVVERLFIDETHKEEEKVLVEDMVERIRNVVLELIEEKTWLDECTKARTKDKAYSMKKKIGYPSVLKNDTHMELEYADFVFHEPSYFQNILKVKSLKSRRELEKIKKQMKHEKQHQSIAKVVNAGYSPRWNTIYLPAGLLQPPLLDTRYPAYLNYGGYGTIIGHEIIHGFDSKGRKYTKDGEYSRDGGPNQWWTNASIAEFENRTKCLVKQYSSFYVKGINQTINGKRTLQDNISDNGGVKASWLAYKKWLEQSNGGKPEPTLPGLNYSTPQLFFLNFAYRYCDKERPEATKKWAKGAVHSDSPNRIIGTLQNSKDFAIAFQCKEGTYMNPIEKCEVW